MESLGLYRPESWPLTVLLAVTWLVLMVAYSPLADRIASYLVARPPTLGAFRAVQQSTGKLIAGIVVAWVLGAFLEELLLRGVMLQFVERRASQGLPRPLAIGAGVVVAAFIAALLHLYQGARAALIIGQLSVLFGLLFVIAGHDLWAVILCHGLFDTIAMIRFATKRSKYSDLDAPPAG